MCDDSKADPYLLYEVFWACIFLAVVHTCPFPPYLSFHLPPSKFTLYILLLIQIMILLVVFVTNIVYGEDFYMH